MPGNEIDGLAVIEASNTTLFVPPEWHVRIDEHDIYWIERKDSSKWPSSASQGSRWRPTRLFEKTGHLFGYEKLARKESDPGTYEAVWHILSNICNAAWSVGCMASTSPVAAEGGDALWALHTRPGEAICVSRGITAHPGLLADMIKNFIRLDYEDYPGFKQRRHLREQRSALRRHPHARLRHVHADLSTRAS